jgi:PAS domain S-box-containing protein
MQTPTTRTFKLLITSAVLIPVLMFLFAIWRDYRAIQEANRIELTRTVITFKHHALNVFETHQLIAERVNERLKGLDWDRIAGSSELRPFLKSIVAEYPQAQAIWLADPSGVVRNGSEILPEQPISIRDRDYFKALLEKDCGIFVGHIVKPLVMRKLNFNLACRRVSPTGRFDGVIIVTVFPEYFSNFWNSVAPRRDSTVTLLRGDGSVLSRTPRIDPDHLRLPPGSRQLAAMRRAEAGTFSAVSDLDNVKRSYSYRKLDKYDAYVVYGVNESALLQAWLRHVRKDGCFFALGMATLLWFSLAANRYSRREQAARLALQESEERLRQLGDNLPDSAVYQYIHEDDGAVRFIYFSKGIERLNGVSAAEVLRDASVLLRQVTPEYYREMVAAEAESARTGSDFAMELPMLRSDGELRWMQLHSRPRRLPNGRVVWDGVQTDVTSRRQAEDALRKLNEELDTRVAQRTLELRQKDQLMIQQSRHAAMGEMIHNIAHQWRQPLNALGLTVQRLQFYYELGEFDKDLLDQSVESSMLLIQHMSKTIDDFRDFFKPDKEPEEFTVSQVVQRTLKLIEASFENSQIRIVCDSLEDITVTGYPNEYSQVILNILNNAKDALLVREIADPVVTIAARAEAGRSVLTISDNAGGIAEDILPKVFDPLFTTKGPQGTGIGLFMAKTIIERSMSGEVTVRNAEAGAEFRIVV